MAYLLHRGGVLPDPAGQQHHRRQRRPRRDGVGRRQRGRSQRLCRNLGSGRADAEDLCDLRSRGVNVCRARPEAIAVMWLPGIRLARAADALAIADMSREYIEYGLGWSWTTARIAA